MSTMSISDIRSYISDLEIPEAGPSPRIDLPQAAATFKEGEPGAAVDGRSLVSFVGDVSGLHRSDVKNSTLLAQLAATKKFNPEKQMRDWYAVYRDVLANIGWNVPSFIYNEYTPSSTSLVLSDAILQILKAISTGNEMKIIEAALSGLRDKPQNEGALTLFEKESFPGSTGNFQIFPVSEDRGDVVMALAALEFKAEKHVSRFLWFKWTSSTVKLFQSAQKCVLNEDVYSRVREDIILKLGDRADTYVRDLEI